MTGAIASGIAAYLSTNFDGMVLLVGLLAAGSGRAGGILCAQWLSMAILVSVALLCSCLALLVPAYFLGALGFIPLGIGVLRLKQTILQSGRASTGGTDAVPGIGLVSATLMLLASGGDNLAVYVPLFAGESRLNKLILVAVFAVMTPLSFVIARVLTDRPCAQRAAQRFGGRVMPLILMVLGISTVVRTGGLEVAISSLGAAL